MTRKRKRDTEAFEQEAGLQDVEQPNADSASVRDSSSASHTVSGPPSVSASASGSRQRTPPDDSQAEKEVERLLDLKRSCSISDMQPTPATEVSEDNDVEMAEAFDNGPKLQYPCDDMDVDVELTSVPAPAPPPPESHVSFYCLNKQYIPSSYVCAMIDSLRIVSTRLYLQLAFTAPEAQEVRARNGQMSVFRSLSQ